MTEQLSASERLGVNVSPQTAHRFGTGALASLGRTLHLEEQYLELPP